jgi:two-component system, NarL family, invasion response regulator UvrY
MISVLIADDHPMVRTGVRQLLSEDPKISEIGEAGSGVQTLQRLRQGHWSVLLLDINMPDRNGLDILRNISVSHPETRVLVLSGFAERMYAVNVLRAGARGYLSKESAPTELLAAIHAVVNGRRYISAEVAEQLASSLDSNAAQAPHSCLSEREFQVFYKLANGDTVSSIGNELCLSVKTVSTYRSRILEKLQMQSNADMTKYAFQNSLV